MSLFQKIEEIEKRLSIFENSIPDWIPLSSYLATQYGYGLNGFRNYCQNNIDPIYFKKFGNTYHIHKSTLPQLKKK